MTRPRFSTARRALLAAALAAPLLAAAQSPFPSRPITMIVPQAPGGTNDIVGRVVSQKLAEVLQASVVVDNRPGAGGNIGTQLAAKAPKDGYTLLMTISSTQAINPALYKNPGFDPVKDFRPIALIGAVPNVLLVHPSFPAKNLSELIALAKAKPNGYQYASAGNGTLNHLLGEMLNSMAGIELQHVPYKGVAPAMNDVLGGQLPILFGSLPSSLAHIKAGKLRALAVSGSTRSPVLPDVPTIGEVVRGYSGTLWIGLFAPAGVPADVSARLEDAMAKALVAKDLRDKLEQQGVEIAGTPTQPVGSEAFAKLLQEDLVKWSRIVKASGATVD
ncbi:MULTISPECIES: tripartite tricarboxylate transporter substrate binding protein [Ramlibacter]|uniref:Tripartite tricarboxylate transporter substrate binding protein n=1 Tax=Ramlibacter pinisoli TaxID=2682844 RepID=A0A6N8IY24_9BURK|nr:MULTISPECIES: tripartite tricarboxylate transporter substrate binding protein [Ramlibacter]MBA2960994.1 tripartite tricarboxylate transporter substrate binding protein [Ramlibacter sp. CGMCC 1.13660]MVQ30940.1 tripartite tricarboxylate transporter substrate binding protein [Ramlibacter pinisoli]